MSKIAIVYPESGWILGNIAKRIAEADDRFTLCAFPQFPHDADAVYYVDVQNCWHTEYKQDLPNTVHVGMFTHLDKDNVSSMRLHWLDMDGIVHMCSRYAMIFREMGWYKDRQIILYPGDVRNFSQRILRIGVCQRGGFPGKGDPFFQKVLHHMGRSAKEGVRFIIKGSGWDRNAFPEHIDVEFWEEENYVTYQEFYDTIDYLVIPSLWEGGPMAYLEALATGTPVIAADVGFVRDLDPGVGVATFEPGNISVLSALLSQLTMDRVAMRRKVTGLTYENYADSLYGFIEELKQKTVVTL